MKSQIQILHTDDDNVHTFTDGADRDLSGALDTAAHQDPRIMASCWYVVLNTLREHRPHEYERLLAVMETMPPKIIMRLPTARPVRDRIRKFTEAA